MTQFIVLYDDAKRQFKKSSETIASITGGGSNQYDFDVGAGGQQTFSIAESLNNAVIEIRVNGVLQREGASYDYEVNVSTDEIDFTYTVQENAWVSVTVIQQASASEYNHFDVSSPGQTQFIVSNGTIQATNVIEVYENGIIRREGASHDYVRNVGANAVDFNYTVQENAWVLVKVSD